MKRVFIPVLMATAILLSFPFTTAQAEDDCVTCTSDTCVDCCKKPQPPQYIVGQFDIEESDRYDQQLADWNANCGNAERCVNCSVEVGPIAPRDQSEAPREQSEAPIEEPATSDED